MNALAGDWLSLVAAFIQFILGIILAIGAIFLALNIMNRLAKGLEEFEELKKAECRRRPPDGWRTYCHRSYHTVGVIGITSALI